MPDAIDHQQCDDIVCARGGHYACHDLPPPVPRRDEGAVRVMREAGVTFGSRAALRAWPPTPRTPWR